MPGRVRRATQPIGDRWWAVEVWRATQPIGDRLRPTGMRRIVAWFAAPLVAAAALAGCAGSGGDGASPRPSSAFADRARTVADAWRSSAAVDAWRTGFVPLADFTVPPPSGFPDDGTKQAFGVGWYLLDGSLPSASVLEGTVTFPDGATLSVPIVTAQEAYAAIDQGDPTCSGPPSLPPGPGGITSTSAPCGRLTVTGATLGSAHLRTSQGTATVPAWLFTVRELTEPVARVAVAASAVAAVPTPSVAQPWSADGLVGAEDIIAIDGTRLTYRLGVGACDKDIKPLVYEDERVVVVGGSVVRTSGPCISILKLEPVTVTLGAPVGSRPVVDVATGQALRLTQR